MLEGERLSDEDAQRELAFRRLIDEHLDDGYRTAWLILRNRQDAEDATHDAVLGAWRQWRRLRDPERFEAWFARILVNTCRDRIRRRRVRATEPLVEPPADPTRPYARVDDADAIGRAFATLNADQRAVIVLRFWADLPVAVIAERLGAPAGTVKSRIHHALDRLRAALGSAQEAGHD
jgi:RNA polymerase sigma-70 factor (ECF subfamily)